MGFPYIINLLKNRLSNEERDNQMWQKIIDQDNDTLAVRQAKTNLGSNIHRINELKQALILLNTKEGQVQ